MSNLDALSHILFQILTNNTKMSAEFFVAAFLLVSPIASVLSADIQSVVNARNALEMTKMTDAANSLPADLQTTAIKLLDLYSPDAQCAKQSGDRMDCLVQGATILQQLSDSNRAQLVNTLQTAGSAAAAEMASEMDDIVNQQIDEDVAAANAEGANIATDSNSDANTNGTNTDDSDD